MVEILKIDFSKLRISEVIEFFSLVFRICQKYGIDAMKLEGPFRDFSESFVKAESVFKIDKSNEITAELLKQDQLRDHDFICLRTIAAGYTYHFRSEKKQAAQLILKTIGQYGNRIYALNFESQTALVRNLCKDLLTKPELIQALETLLLMEVVVEMKYNNEKFSDLYILRNETTSYKSEISAGEALKETINMYRILVKHIDASMLLNSSDNLRNIITEINTLVDRYGVIIKLRHGKVKEDEKETPAEMA